MSSCRSMLSNRTARRQAWQRSRRLGMESLERRDCPAVDAFFIGGVLSVVGDKGNNVIELFQPRDRVVQVVGDGRTWVFEDVDEVLVDAGDGDDQAISSKPKEIVVVGAKLHFAMGAGNDRIKIEGGQPDEPAALPRVGWEVSVDFGSGADELTLVAGDADAVNLDVHSMDGFDSVSVNLELPAVQKIRAAAARISMELAGGGNLIDVSAKNFDQVDLALAASGGANTVHGDIELLDPYMTEDHPPYCAISLDFGGGGNLVDLNTQEFDQSDLDLRASGGNNTVKHEVGHTLGFRHEHTRPEARIDMDLAGGGNSVEVRMENMEDVDLSIVGEPITPEPVTGGTINVYWHVIKNGADSNPRLGGVVILSSSLPGGSEAPRGSGISSAQLNLVGSIRDVVPSAASIDLDLGSGNDTVSIDSSGVDDIDLNLNTGDGDDSVEVALEGASPNSTVGSHELRGAVVKINTGAGDDRVAIADGHRVSGRITGIAADPLEAVVDLGTGADALTAQIHNTNTVHWDVHSADGFDILDVQMEHAFPGFAGGVSVAVGDVNLEGGNNLVNVHSEGYDHVNLGGSISGGDNQIEVGMINLWVRDQTIDPTARVSLDFGGSNNRGSVSNQGFGVWEVNLATPASSDAPALQPTLLISKMRAMRDHVTPPAGSVTFIIDGNPQVAGSDGFEVHGQGFGTATVDANTAGGNDSIWIDFDLPVRLNLTTGDGDDDVRVDNQPQRWFSEGPAPINLLSIDTGAGEDKVVVRAQAGNPFPFTRDGRSSGMVVDLGEGNDVAELSLAGFSNDTLNLSAGDGNDQVNVSTAGGGAWKTENGGLSWLAAIDLGAGDDTVHATALPSVTDLVLDRFGSVGMTIVAGEGNDAVEVETNWTNGVGKYLTLRPRPTQSIDERLSVITGAGEDRVAISERVGPFFNLKSSRLQHDLDLGPGNDQAEINSRGYGDLTSTIDAGDGDDTIVSTSSPPAGGAVAAVLYATLHNNDLGPGDDRLVIEDSGYTRESIFVDAGDGDDEVRTRVTSIQVTFSTQVTFAGAVGAGSDKLAIETSGYRQVKLAINTGPEGDGNDTIIARLQAPGRGGRKQSGRLTLDGGKDTFEYKAKGYRVQSSSQTPISVEWVFMA